METILVTGACGFIGSNLCRKLIELGYQVIAFDNLQTGKLSNLITHPNLIFIEGDVNKRTEILDVFPKYHPDYVFHYAACVGVQRTLAKPLEVLEDIKGLENILLLSTLYNVKRIFYSSSSEVYGEPVIIPQNEVTTPLNSRLPYAVVKNLGEVMIKTYHKEYGLPYTIFRFFNTYGTNQSDNFVVSKFIKQALNNEDITIYGQGGQTRTFMYIDDNIDATTKCLSIPETINETINIGNNVETSILELANTIVELTSSNSQISFLSPLKEGDMTRRVPDITKMCNLLKKYYTLTPLKTGLSTLINSQIKIEA